jgi:2-dehydro-3-deoxygluconokinase
MEKQLDLIGIGECLVEFSDIGNGQYQIGYSGDVLNALSAAGRLGLSTGLLSATGDDPFTEGLRHILNVERIDLSHTPVLEGKPNGVYFLSIDAMSLPTFHFLRQNSAAREMFNAQPISSLIEYVRSARALLFSSIPLAVIKDKDKLFELLRAAKGETILAFDLNIRRALWNDLDELVALLGQLAPLIDILFITNEDDTILFGPRHASEALNDYVRRGFRQVVIRRGGLPTLVSSEASSAMREQFEVPVPHVANIIDTTGAGDAFDAGYIAAMLRNHLSYECAAMGNATAAVSLESRGGRAVGLTIDRVEKLYRPLVKWGTFHVPTRR